MKLAKFIILMFFSLFILISCSDNSKEYSEYTSEFIEVSTDEIEHLIDQKESFHLYIGRENCPYCQIFVPKLYEASTQSNHDLFHLDLLSSKNNEEEIIKFSEKYDMQYVPALIYFENGDNFNLLDIDSENIEVSEIEAFLSQ